MRAPLLAAILLVAGFAAAAGPQSFAPHGAILRHPSPPTSSAFGWTVAALDVNGDGFGDAAVSDRLDGAGAVFIFLGGTSGTSTTPAFTLRGAAPLDQFGDGLAALGDVDGDGRGDLAVGAPYARGPADEPYAGRIYVFLASSLTTSTPADAAALVLHASHAQARLGMRIAGGMDATGDAVPDMLVGEPHAGAGIGAVYLVSGTTRGVHRVDRVAAAAVTGESPGDGLGSHGISFVTDVTKDGRAEWAVGSPRFGTGDAGRVYLFTTLPNGLSAKNASFRVWDGAAAGDNFGFALANLRITSTQIRVVIGAYGADGTGAAGGRAYLISPTALNGSGALRAVTTVKGFDAGATGASLAVGDFNGDLIADLVLGAPTAQIGSSSPGEIGFVLGPLPTGIFSASDFGARVGGDYNSGRFGHAVAIVPKPDAKHSAGILVGAYRGTAARAHLLVNERPVAGFSLADVPCTGPTTPVLLNASGSSDPDGPADIWLSTWTRIASGGVRIPAGVGTVVPIQLAPSSYQYELVVTDNYLATSLPVLRSFAVTDTVAPTMRLSRPDGGVLYYQDVGVLDLEGVLPLARWVTHVDRLTVRANVTDLCSPVGRVEFYLEDQLAHVDLAPPYEWTYDPHEFWPAFKHIYARAWDAQGNGPTINCVHVVNTAWLNAHHLPVVGQGPPPGFQDTLVPDPPGHAVAGDAHCDKDGVDAILPDEVHPLDP